MILSRKDKNDNSILFVGMPKDLKKTGWLLIFISSFIIRTIKRKISL